MDFGFACAVASFAQILRGSGYARGLSIVTVIKTAKDNMGNDHEGYRNELITLLQTYKSMARNRR